MALLVGATAVPGVGASHQQFGRLRQVSSRPHLGMPTFQLPWTQIPTVRRSVKFRKQVVQAAGAGSGTEKQFKTTVELDKLIDTLRNTEYEKLPQVVAENVLAFNTDFWLRLAARADISESSADQRDYEILANNIMTVVELIVQKTKEKIESSTDVLKSILSPLIETSGEITWPPNNPDTISIMRKEVERREEGGYLDESFLSEVSAQLRQATEDGDKPGLVAILQKVLQLYAGTLLSRRSYAVKGDQVDEAEALLERVIGGDEEKWDELLRTGLVYGGGSVEPNALLKVVEKRVERTLMRTESGSYQQRLLIEYVREIQTRVESLVAAFQTSSS